MLTFGYSRKTPNPNCLARLGFKLDIISALLFAITEHVGRTRLVLCHLWWYFSTVFSRLNAMSSNSCEKPWRQTSIITDFQHLLHWTLCLWFILCQNVPSLSSHLPPLTTELPRHCGRRNEEWTSPHRLVFAWVHSASHLFKLPSAKLLSRFLATVQITTFIPESHEFCVHL